MRQKACQPAKKMLLNINRGFELLDAMQEKKLMDACPWRSIILLFAGALIFFTLSTIFWTTLFKVAWLDLMNVLTKHRLERMGTALLRTCHLNQQHQAWLLGLSEHVSNLPAPRQSCNMGKKAWYLQENGVGTYR